MSVIGDVLFDFVGELLGYVFGRGFHATGRRLIFLFTLGHVRIPSQRHGGADGEGWSDFGVQTIGFLFWLAVAALTIYLLVT